MNASHASFSTPTPDLAGDIVNLLRSNFNQSINNLVLFCFGFVLFLFSRSAETGAEPSLQATQMRLKRARLADNLNEKIAQRPGPMELVEKNILPVDSSVKEAIIGEWAGPGARRQDV